MNLNFTYNPNDYEEVSYEPLPVGEYRIRIDFVEPKESKNGNTYFAFEFAVSGDNRKLWYNLVLTDDKKMTNQKLGAFFKSFGITDYDLTHWQYWPGKVGACKTKIRPAEGEYSARAEVHYFLPPEKAEKLAPWVEPSNGMLAGTSGMQETAAPPWEDNPF